MVLHIPIEKQKMENKDFKMDQVAIRIIKEPPLQADYPIEREKATKTPVKKTKSKTKEAELGV